jgi:putative heme iron utilization protein
MALCELKTRGFVEIIERLLEHQGTAIDGERRSCESEPYQVDKTGNVLTVVANGQTILEMQGSRPAINQLTPRDLLHIARIASKLPPKIF